MPTWSSLGVMGRMLRRRTPLAAPAAARLRGAPAPTRAGVAPPAAAAPAAAARSAADAPAGPRRAPPRGRRSRGDERVELARPQQRDPFLGLVLLPDAGQLGVGGPGSATAGTTKPA